MPSPGRLFALRSLSKLQSGDGTNDAARGPGPRGSAVPCHSAGGRQPVADPVTSRRAAQRKSLLRDEWTSQLHPCDKGLILPDPVACDTQRPCPGASCPGWVVEGVSGSVGLGEGIQTTVKGTSRWDGVLGTDCPQKFHDANFANKVLDSSFVGKNSRFRVRLVWTPSPPSEGSCCDNPERGLSAGRRSGASDCTWRVGGPQVSGDTVPSAGTSTPRPFLGSAPGVCAPVPGLGPPRGRATSSEVQVLRDPLTSVSVISVPTPGFVFLSCGPSEVTYRLIISLPPE